MKVGDSNLNRSVLDEARALLNPPPRRDPMWPALAAATALAITSLVFAAVMVLAPPVQTEHVAQSAP